MPLRLLPDAELLVVNRLRAAADITAIVGTRVYTEIPATPTFPLLRINRVGGIPEIRQHLDVARIQIDAWATSKFQARRLAATAQAALHSLVGAHAEGVVTAVEDDLGLTWSPDDATGTARYVFGCALWLHPTPS
jgi:hypothetical protein